MFELKPEQNEGLSMRILGGRAIQRKEIVCANAIGERSFPWLLEQQGGQCGWDRVTH